MLNVVNEKERQIIPNYTFKSEILDNLNKSLI